MFRTLDRRYALFNTEQGYQIRGLLHPADEGQIPAFQWTTPRLVFRTSPESLAKPGDIIIDVQARRFILAEHGAFQHGETPLYKVFRCIKCTGSVSWTRTQKTLDPVTRLEREGVATEFGPIWVAIEPLGRLDTDRDIRVREDARQCLTSADVRFNDIVDGQSVKRIQKVLGLKLLELG